MSQSWFTLKNGKEEGPFTFTDLKNKYSSGELLPSDKIRPSDMVNWNRADHYKELVTDNNDSASPKKSRMGFYIIAIAFAVILINAGVIFYYFTQTTTSDATEEELFSVEVDPSEAAALYPDLDTSAKDNVCKIAFFAVDDDDEMFNIYIMDLNSNEPVKLTDSGKNASSRFFPDGSKLLFTSDRSGLVGIYKMDIDGSNQVRISSSKYESWTPSLSPDGSKIAFSTDLGQHEFLDIYLMDVDGENLQRLTADSGNNYTPSWSPDGNIIAFVSDREVEGIYDLYIMDDDGSNQTRLTDSGYYYWGATWSPDGTKIAFETFRENNWAIYVIDIDGENETLLSASEGEEGEAHPNWSYDGRKIAFFSDRNGIAELYIMDTDGSNQQKLDVGHLEGTPCYAPKFSPHCTFHADIKILSWR